MNSRTFVYVDGFNLYFGALRGSPHKWLDLQRYFLILRPHDQIQVVRYFTALVAGKGRANQEAYLRALETLPLVNIHLGRFKSKRVRCLVSGCDFSGDRLFLVPEEKLTDVNIATHMLDDAYQKHCDRMILVSGDSDLVPALSQLKVRFPNLQVTVYVPSRNLVRGAAVELRSAADKNRTLPLNLLWRAQLPQRVPDGAGGWITKPAGW